MDNIIMFSSSSIWILLLSSLPVWSIEEPHQEIYLQPRNFNPHPYEIEDRRSPPSARGPILFPPSPSPETIESNFIMVKNTRKPSHPVDSHPYSKLVRKHKYRNPGRHQEYENQINPQISRALAGHAKKVLGHSRSDYPDIEQKNYAFSYKVVDHLTGDDFSHTQSQNEKATSGEYRVKLPDGRVQIVSYTADKNGYKADVKYQDADVSEADPQQRDDVTDKRGRIGSFRNIEFNGGEAKKYRFDHRGVGVGLKATPAVPIHENHIEDYDYDLQNERVVYATSPTPSAQLVFGGTQPTYQSYESTSSHLDSRLYPSPYQNDLQTNNHQQIQSHRFQIIPHNKVQIVNQGIPALTSTVSPSYLENPGIILSTPTPQFSGDYPHVFVKSINGVYGKK